MRLLSTSLRSMKQFDSGEPPPYAALSHCWGKAGQEVLFEELMLLLGPVEALSPSEIRQTTEIRNRSGYAKIRACCVAAAEQGLSWVWIDTCCIDKRSSAELSEAINSMWRWYESSICCFVYLADVRAHSIDGDFKKSRWFKRSWTLQELIAPEEHIFYDAQWNMILTLHKEREAFTARGTRITDISPSRHLSPGSVAEAARLPVHVVERPGAWRSYSVAQKLSWAANREATRVEDKAYSLLGLLQINMPLLYGEQRGAFQRLQKELIKESADETILAWEDPSPTLREQVDRMESVLALSPRYFTASGDVGRANARRYGGSAVQAREPYSITHKGLEITGIVYRADTRALFPLNCFLLQREDTQCFLALKAISASDPLYKDCYVRTGLKFYMRQHRERMVSQGWRRDLEKIYIYSRDPYELRGL